MDDEIKKEHYSLAYLRQQAQAFLSETGVPDREFSESELTALLHEFYIQQAEMEIQNEELRNTLEMLDAERRRFSDYFETAPIGYFVLDENSAIGEVNLAGADLLGIQRQHMKGRLFSRFVSPSFRSGYYRHLQAVKDELIRQSCEVEMLRPDRQPLPVRLDSIAILDQNGLTGLRTAMTDLTGRRRMEADHKAARSDAALQKNENIHLLERFRMVAESTHAAIFICNGDRFLYVNSACERITGYPRKTLLEMKPVQVLYSAEQGRVQGEIQGVIDRQTRGYRCELAILTAQGREVRVEVTVNRTFDDGAPAILGTALDITSHKELESELSAQLEARTEELAQVLRKMEEGQHLDDLRTLMEMMVQEKDGGRRALEENISANLRQVIFPEIRNLKQKSRDKEIRRLLLLLEKELEQLTSAFSSTLSSSRYGLTPMEIRISALIREGLTTDEISEHLHIASKTVSFHRSNIREKLGIKNHKINLQTYLLNLF